MFQANRGIVGCVNVHVHTFWHYHVHKCDVETPQREIQCKNSVQTVIHLDLGRIKQMAKVNLQAVLVARMD